MRTRTLSWYDQTSQSNNLDNCDCTITETTKSGKRDASSDKSKAVAKKAQKRPISAKPSKPAKKKSVPMKKAKKAKAIVKKKKKSGKKSKPSSKSTGKSPKKLRKLTSGVGKVSSSWQSRLRPRPLKSAKQPICPLTGKPISLSKMKKAVKRTSGKTTSKKGKKKAKKSSSKKSSSKKSSKAKKSKPKKSKSKSGGKRKSTGGDSGSKKKTLCDYIPGCTAFRRYFSRSASASAQTMNANNSLKRKRMPPMTRRRITPKPIKLQRGRRAKPQEVMSVRRRKGKQGQVKKSNVKLYKEKIIKRSRAPPSRINNSSRKSKTIDCKTEPVLSSDKEANLTTESLIDTTYSQLKTPSLDFVEDTDVIKDSLSSDISCHQPPAFASKLDFSTNLNNNRCEFMQTDVGYFHQIAQNANHRFGTEVHANLDQQTDEIEEEEIGTRSASRASQATEESEIQIFGTELGDH